MEELLARHIPSLWAYIFRKYSLDEYLVDDVVGDTVLAIWENYDSYDPSRGEFQGWAFGIARNKLLERLRKEKRDDRELSIIESDDGNELGFYKEISTTRCHMD